MVGVMNGIEKKNERIENIVCINLLACPYCIYINEN